MTIASELRLRGELLHQDLTAATFCAWVAAGATIDSYHRRGMAYRYAVTVSLRPGYSGQDHLYHRSLAAVADALDERPAYATAAALRRAVERACLGRYGESDIELVEPTGYETPPADIAPHIERIEEAAVSAYRRKLARNPRIFHGQTDIVLPADVQSVRYDVPVAGTAATYTSVAVKGSRDQIVAALRDAGYTIAE